MANINKFENWFKELQNSNDWCFNGSQELQNKWNTLLNNSNGWASAGLLHILNYAVTNCLEGSEEYLEVGTYCGRSLCGALDGNTANAQVIDPFELFLPDGLVIYDNWYRTIKKNNIDNRIRLHKTLVEDYQGNMPPIGIYLYDGDHEYGATYRGLTHMQKYLSDQAVIIVDDILMKEVAPCIDLYLKNNIGCIKYLGETPFNPHHQAVMIFNRK
jgi:hypothetical protein